MNYNTLLLQRGLNAQFEQQYQQFLQTTEVAIADSMFTQTRSTRAAEKYAWLGDVPGVQEWLGTKDMEGISDYDFEIKNKDWYAGFSVDRNEIDDEGISATGPRVSALAQAVAQWKFELLFQLITNGDTALAFDGSAYFANRSNNDNLLAGSGVTLANLKTDITTARATMMNFVTDKGRAMHIRGNLIVCPPSLEVTMLEAINAPSIATAGTGTAVNPLSGFGLSVLALPELESDDANDWYFFCTNRPLKPFIYQERKGVVPVLDDTQVGDTRKLKYSAEMRGNAGYGFPQMGIKVVNS